MTDEYLIEQGYKKYEPTRFDNESVVARFQKRFDDDFGKKYFIDVLKWSNDYGIEYKEIVLIKEIMEYLESHKEEINELCVGYDWEDREVINEESKEIEDETK